MTRPHSPVVQVRIPAPLLKVARAWANAAGLTVSAWIRSLIERETGVAAGDMRDGLARRPKWKRRLDAKLGAKARHQKGNGDG